MLFDVPYDIYLSHIYFYLHRYFCSRLHYILFLFLFHSKFAYNSALGQHSYFLCLSPFHFRLVYFFFICIYFYFYFYFTFILYIFYSDCYFI